MILNGSVEVVTEGKPNITMHLGDAFGVKAAAGVIHHKGVMRTRVDDCQVSFFSLHYTELILYFFHNLISF